MRALLLLPLLGLCACGGGDKSDDDDDDDESVDEDTDGFGGGVGGGSGDGGSGDGGSGDGGSGGSGSDGGQDIAGDYAGTLEITFTFEGTEDELACRADVWTTVDGGSGAMSGEAQCAFDDAPGLLDVAWEGTVGDGGAVDGWVTTETFVAELEGALSGQVSGGELAATFLIVDENFDQEVRIDGTLTGTRD